MLSLRPGGGRGGSRLFFPRSTLSSSSSSDLTDVGDAPSFAVKRGDSRFEGHEILRFTREQLLQLKEAFEVSETILKLSQELASDLFGDEQSWGRSESQSGPPPALVKAEVPWSARRGTLSEKDQVLKTVKGILNKMTPEKYDLLKGQLIDSEITSADILKGAIQLIFEKA
ncbi:Eukaryotic translation initiation factor isoform 4G-2 [Raphanus sativus]|nr:Eukaryotic translation initiation factor isoform 4G-2 [Raphanus sativus]